MKNKKRICSECGTPLRKVRDFIRQSGYPYYLECPNDCENKKRRK